MLQTYQQTTATHHPNKNHHHIVVKLNDGSIDDVDVELL
jgi:hypothetical protein